MEKYIKQAELIARGTEILPGGVEELAKKLKKAEEENTPLRVKLGLDPTKPDLHLGHSVVMRKLKQYQDLGHHVVLIIGDATAMIGDPSGKSETRKTLTKEEVKENAQTYLDQMRKIVNVENAEIVYNSKWLHSLNLEMMLELASKITVAQMMVRDDFSKRYKEGRPISVHEFFYPLMQAYDSHMVKADIELGGTDQRFNVLLGRDIQIAYGDKPQIVQLLPLLEGTDGVVKMSKTYPENCISLTEDPNNMFGKIMSIPDTMIMRYFELLTDIPNDELARKKENLEAGMNPRDLKMELGKVIVSYYHSQDAANAAQDYFINLFAKKQLPDDMPEITVSEGSSLADVIVEMDFCSSKGEVKRLVKGGGIKLDGDKVSDPNMTVAYGENPEIVLQVGKRKFAKLKKSS